MCNARIATRYVPIRTNTTMTYWYVLWHVFLYVLVVCIDTCLVCINTYPYVVVCIAHVLPSYLVCIQAYWSLIHANTYLNTCINTCTNTEWWYWYVFNTYPYVVVCIAHVFLSYLVCIQAYWNWVHTNTYHYTCGNTCSNTEWWYWYVFNTYQYVLMRIWYVCRLVLSMYWPVSNQDAV